MSGGRADEVLAIGSFARASGLSIPRLRRYHELGLLVPSHVDPDTGYRYYLPEQLTHAQAIGRLRQVDMPMPDVRQALGAPPSERLAILRRHLDRLHDRLADTQRLVELVDQLIREEAATMTTTSIQLMEVVLQVDDVDATVGFYRGVFGFEFQPDDHGGAAPLHYDACGGAWEPDGFFLFTIFPSGGQPTTTRFGFGVPDLDAVWARVPEHGGEQLSPPTESGHIPKAALVKDPAGNVLNLYERAGW